MPKKKTNEKQWGGRRKGAGRPEGKTKVKICVSVNQTVWQSALNLWRGKTSPLVEILLSDYVEKSGGGKHAEAI